MAKRQGWICHLCGGTVPKQFNPLRISPKAATKDHLVPKVHGGTRANAALAHSWCNSARGHLDLELAHARRELFAEGMELAVLNHSQPKMKYRQRLREIRLKIQEGVSPLPDPRGSE